MKQFIILNIDDFSKAQLEHLLDIFKFLEHFHDKSLQTKLEK